MNALEKPGIPKTSSTRNAPVRKPASVGPKPVSTGVIALRMMWRLMTIRSRSPFALAVRT